MDKHLTIYQEDYEMDPNALKKHLFLMKRQYFHALFLPIQIQDQRHLAQYYHEKITYLRDKKHDH